MLTSHILPPLSAKLKQAVIFLHGVGDSGTGGMLGIGKMWRRDLPNCEFLCPDAPFPFDQAPTGRQWFSLKRTDQISMLAGAKLAAPYLNEYIDHVLATRQLQPRQLALVGFSQGTIMALYVALRRASEVAGIVGYSGILVGGDDLPKEKRSSPQILLIHGTADDVVPYATFGPTAETLKRLGILVATITHPGLGHSIDDVGVAEGLKFLKQVL